MKETNKLYADLSAVKNIAQTVGKTMNSYKVVVDKSTVPVRTGKEVEKIILSQLKKCKKTMILM